MTFADLDRAADKAAWKFSTRAVVHVVAPPRDFCTGVTFARQSAH